MKPFVAGFCIFALSIGCHSPDEPAATNEAPQKAKIGAFGIDTAQMDTTVKPGDDFYKHVNGTWLATFKMPADKARYGIFDALADKSEEDIHALLEELDQHAPAPGSIERKVVDFYNSWMNEATIDARNIEPLKGDLEAINAAKTKADIMKLMGRFDYASPVAMYISPDPADTSKYVVNITQAGLGMPNRDYYLKTGPALDGYRKAYKTYVARILELIADAKPAESADAVIGLESKLATVHWAPERQRDVEATNNPVDRPALKKMIPAVDWDSMLSVDGLGEVQHFVIN